MNIIVFGGTTEGRVLAERLAEAGHRVTVHVATEIGAEAMGEHSAAEVRVGRLNAQGLHAALMGYDLCIDATHPYAVEITQNLRAVCGEIALPLRRLLRPESGPSDCVTASSCARAAEFLQGTQGNILLTIGAKELSAFSALPPERLYARVLPTHQGIEACLALQLPHRNILALQGPFTQKMNEAMLEQYQIRWLVTKDGGRAGGYREKERAARALGIPLVLVCRPHDSGNTLEELLEEFGKGEECHGSDLGGSGLR